MTGLKAQNKPRAYYVIEVESARLGSIVPRHH
jgi:hypothetical protein